MALGDWIKIDRSLLKSPIFAHEGMFRLWIFCLMKANWKDGKWLVPGTLSEMKIPRGTFIIGRESLWEQMYPKRDEDGQIVKRDHTPTSRTVWRWMEALERMGCVKLENVSNRCTHVTICKYGIYQDDARGTCPTGVQPVSSTCPTGVQHVSTIEESNIPIKKERKKEILGAADAAGEVSIPPELAKKIFIDAWRDWIAYRKGRRLTTRPETMRDQLEALIPLGPEAAAECVLLSKRNGWQGIFPEKIKSSRVTYSPADPRGNMATITKYLEGLEDGAE